VLTTPDAITQLCTDANASPRCAGIVAWMHTFSPAKMWLGGLRLLAKPIVHLHTQFNRDLPWNSIDMDFMNLNQSAHGDREFGYMATRLGLNRKVVVGHWQDDDVQARVGAWARAAAAWHDSQRLKIARFGDNMREVAVTEGDKVEAQARFGYSVNGFGIGDLACATASSPNTTRATTWPTHSARAATDAPPCARPQPLNSACARSSKTAASAHSPTRSRICTASISCPESPCSA
jgi:L-arabinose isomerase